MSEKDLVVETREMLAKATPGPWFDWDNAEWVHEPKHLLSNVEDSTVIARAPELLSALCDEVERLRRELNEGRRAFKNNDAEWWQQFEEK